MKPLPEAQSAVLDGVTVLAPLRMPIWSSLGLCPAEPIVAEGDIPPFANSAMDGYAVIAADVASAASGAPVILDVVDSVAAGHVSAATVRTGTAIQIMTGAPLPDGADAVVKVEDTEVSDGTVVIHQHVVPGTAVRRAGSDIEKGDTLIEPGVRLGPAHVALLATAGASAPLVHRRPRVAVLSTGDEVKSPETATLEPGWIRDANRPLLLALLGDVGVEVADYGIVADDHATLKTTLERAADECDVIVTSGGVSMGEYDLVKQILAELGGVDLWRVAMQPAKPFAFGSIGSTPFFGLPGNPVSVFVSFEQFLRPAILTMLGSSHIFRPRIRAEVADGWETDGAKDVFTRVVVDWTSGSPIAHLPPGGGQGSHVLSTMAAADAFAVVPRGVSTVSVGQTVDLEMFKWPESRSRREALGDVRIDT